MIEWLDSAHRMSDWGSVRAVVDGLDERGFSAADVLLDLGANVIVLSETQSDKAKLLEVLGADVRGDASLPPCDLLIAAAPSPVVDQAGARGVPVWSDVELAWRLQDRVVPWLGVTGSASVSATAAMAEAMLHAGGLTVSAVGANQRPIVETIMDGEQYDVLVVAMSKFTLTDDSPVRFHSAVVRSVADDDGSDEIYARVYYQVTHSCVYNVAEPRTEAMVEQADVVEGARAIGFTWGIPAMSMMGVVDELLVDRAFIPQRRDSALEVASVADVPTGSPEMIGNALAAAGLARSFGVPATAVRDGLRAYGSKGET